MDSALERAAERLGTARFPVFGGLYTDITGASAALALAETLGGVVDHAGSEGIARTARLMRETGSTPASYGEVRNRADTIVVIGEHPLTGNPGLLDTLLPDGKGLPRPGKNKREVILLGATGGKKTRSKTTKGIKTTDVSGKTALPELVALLAASVREGRFDVRDAALRRKMDAAGARLRSSAFAAFVYDPAELAEPVLHTVLEMVRHLVKTTRAATLSLAAPGNGDGVNLCSTWTCGLPLRTSFARDIPENDMWAYETNRLVKSGEADVLVWIDALDGAEADRPKDLQKGIPSVVLSSRPVRASRDDIVIEVACAGVDHDAALYLPQIAGIGLVKASQAGGGKPTVAEAINRIAALIDAKGAA